MRDRSLYDTDIVAWADTQVAELRRLAADAPTNVLDWENVIEEIESVGRSQVNGVERKLVLVLVHLIKVVSAPDMQTVPGWRAEVVGFQLVVRKQFSQSMRQLLDADAIWRDAIRVAGTALAEWGDPLLRGLPERCPFSLDELVGPEFDIDTALGRLTRAVSG